MDATKALHSSTKVSNVEVGQSEEVARNAVSCERGAKGRGGPRGSKPSSEALDEAITYVVQAGNCRAMVRLLVDLVVAY